MDWDWSGGDIDGYGVQPTGTGGSANAGRHGGCRQYGDSGRRRGHGAGLIRYCNSGGRRGRAQANHRAHGCIRTRGADDYREQFYLYPGHS